MLAQNPFAFRGVEAEQRLREDELQHGVAQELEPLVAFSQPGTLREQRRMGEGAFQQRPVAEDVVEASFELGDRIHHELALA
jgi:hypothetical protein